MNVQTKAGKAILFNEAGGPDVLKLIDVKVPFPAPHEVRIQVKAVGINRVDTSFRQGVYYVKPLFPSKLGFEAAGIIDAVGSEVKGIIVGDKVSVIGTFLNKDYGTYGDLILVPSDTVQKHPENLSFKESAGLWVSFLAAYGLAVYEGLVQTGQTVLINAASGATGLAIIQIVNMIGGIPIALTSTANKKQELIDAGAAHVIVTNEQDLVSSIRAITDNIGVNVVLDAVGGSLFEQLISATAMKGRVITYGSLSKEKATWPSLQVIGKKLTIKGFDMTEFLMDKSKAEEAIAFINQGVVSEKLKPVIGRTFPLQEANEAHRYLESNTQIGKVVLMVS